MRSKYGNKKTVINGIEFDSKAEAERYEDLLWLEKAGTIVGLKRQVPFEIIPALVLPDGTKWSRTEYVADFRYYDTRKREWVTEDVKGFKTDVYKLKRKLMYKEHGIVIYETGRGKK